MVYYQDPQLDLAFAALADPTRRAILARLADEDGLEGGLAVSRIAEPFALSLPGVMKHLDVLARAQLIEREKSGRTVRCRLKAAPLESAMQWLSRYERFWTERLNALAKFVEDDSCPNPKLPASLSSARSKRRPRKSSPPGHSRSS
jgi:DNA-binding transcriptional ArsR family regulator